MSDEKNRQSLFVYGSFLPGERDHAHLRDSRHLGSARTAAGFRLVDLGLLPALIVTGNTHVAGELYSVHRDVLMKLDAVREIGRLFHRRTIQLDSGLSAEAYLMDEEQVRGRRRLRVEDWRQRFAPRVPLRF